RLMFFEKIAHFLGEFVRGFGPRAAFFRPRSTRMQCVPQWAQATITTSAGIVIAKAFQRLVPHGTEARYEKRFGEGYPNIIDSEIATIEVVDIEVSCSGILSACSFKRIQRTRPVISVKRRRPVRAPAGTALPM